jgi:hypothetical protein
MGDGSCPNRFLLLHIIVGLRPPGFRLAARLSCLTPTVRPAARSQCIVNKISFFPAPQLRPVFSMSLGLAVRLSCPAPTVRLAGFS